MEAFPDRLQGADWGGNMTFRALDISASGAAAERFRMEVVANNIANASSTRTAEGGPYRRREVVFSAVLEQQMRGSARDAARRGVGSHLGGVQVIGVIEDQSILPKVYKPDHPHAGADGYVEMPNVKMPMEMVDLMTATRSYEANVRVMQAFRQVAEQALSLGRDV